MNINCFLFDALQYDEDIKNSLTSKTLDYRTCVTNSFTTTSLVSFFSGLLPSKINKLGIGYGSVYSKLNEEEKSVWDSKIILNSLDDSWEINYLSDDKNIDFLENECFTVNKKVNKIIYKSFIDEKKKIEDLLKHKKKNRLNFIKLNHLHDAYDCNSEFFTKTKDAKKMFEEIINFIDFEQDDTLFWFFGDHGNWAYIDKYMTPPHSTICWSAIKNNIKQIEDNRQIAHITDFAHYFNNLVYNKSTNFMKEFYYSEDGRGAIDNTQTTTFSVLCEMEANVLYQLSYHAVTKEYKFFRFDYEKQKTIDFDKNVKKENVAILRKKLYEVYHERIKNFQRQNNRRV